ncbi:Hydroxymethylglutaryl-CoA reductase, class I/II, partial [Cynara cardunculus var. scolymus]
WSIARATRGLVRRSSFSINNPHRFPFSSHPFTPSLLKTSLSTSIMDVRRRPLKKLLHRSSKPYKSGQLLKHQDQQKPSDAFPLPLHVTNALFFAMFFSVMYFLLHRWRDKIRNSTPLHVVTFSEMTALISLLASVIYLLGFFGIDFVQSILRPSPASWVIEDDNAEEDTPVKPCGQALIPHILPTNLTSEMEVEKKKPPPTIDYNPEENEEIVKQVVAGTIPSYALETKLGDCRRAASVRREALERITGKSLTGMPLEGFDYESILGQCCEMPVGYIQIPVGIAGPLLLNGAEFCVPMATTEGCLVASTNRGCKAIYMSGGATCMLLKDGMTRAPVVRFGSAKRAAELKLFLEDPENFDTLAVVFNKSSRFGKLQSIKCAIAGKNTYIRFCCSTGDAMGMNMAVIKEEVVRKVLKTNVAALVELNMLKNLTGSAMAGALGGFNAHASNIVAAVYIATGQDPAQNVESSHCITMMEAINDGKDLHISVTMPSVEVGTVGGGTQLASQAACLNLLGVKGASKEEPGSNSRVLATIVAGSVLAGELSLMSAIAAGQLVKSHMKYNRSTRDMTKLAP